MAADLNPLFPFIMKSGERSIIGTVRTFVDGTLGHLVGLFRIPTSDTTVLAFDGERITVKGCCLRRPTVLGIETELRQNGSSPGTIRLRKDGRIIFSAGIDESLHQRIRNLLLS